MEPHRVETFKILPSGESINTGSFNPRVCPHFILVREHYDASGDKCKCTDPNALEMIDWGYVWDGTRWIAGPEGN